MNEDLVLSEVNAGYGPVKVLDGLSLSIPQGQISSLIGRNGSGRSTALKAIMGIVQPDAGSVRLGAIELAGLRPYEVARRGIAYVPEERLVFANLTVEENLKLGMIKRKEIEAWSIDEMYGLFPKLDERRKTKAGNLSGGEQQMLTICRSLLGNPYAILIDEPTEGLAPLIVKALAEVISNINRRGVTILLVEQKLALAMRLSHKVFVMGHGRVVFEGTPDNLRARPDISKQWLEV